MATAPLSMGQKLAPSPRTGDNSNIPAKEKISINQSGKLSFPHVMKKLKSKGDDHDADAPTWATVVGNGQITDAALPPTGIVLPPNLAQDTSLAATQSDQSAAATGDQGSRAADPGTKLPAGIFPDGVRKSKGALSLDRRVDSGDIKVTTSARQEDHKLVDAADNSSAGVKDLTSADGNAKAVDNHDVSTLLESTHNKQSSTIQVMQHTMPGSLLDKHGGLLESTSHAVLNASNGMTHLAQSPDKLNQTPPTPTSISIPLKNSQWGDELGGRIMWMTQHDVNTANIKINPPHLGPLEVKISMHKDQVDVTFNSHHAAVKEALDASIPKLKEMLGNSGLQLGDANVTQHSFSGQSQYQSPGSNQQYFGGSGQENETSIAGDGVMEASPASTWYLDNGAIDFYA